VPKLRTENPGPPHDLGSQISTRATARLRRTALEGLQGANPNFIAANGMHPQMVQAQQAQQHGQQQQISSMQRNVIAISQKFYQQGMQLLSAQYNGQIPPEGMMQYKMSCNLRARQYLEQQMRLQQGRAQNRNMTGIAPQEEEKLPNRDEDFLSSDRLDLQNEYNLLNDFLNNSLLDYDGPLVEESIGFHCNIDKQRNALQQPTSDATPTNMQQADQEKKQEQDGEAWEKTRRRSQRLRHVQQPPNPLRIEDFIGTDDDDDDDDDYDGGDEKKYCICQSASYGDMSACDNESCPIEYFHWSCIGLKNEPLGRWICPVCTKNGKK
jgi:hypothetical protein